MQVTASIMELSYEKERFQTLSTLSSSRQCELGSRLEGHLNDLIDKVDTINQALIRVATRSSFVNKTRRMKRAKASLDHSVIKMSPLLARSYPLVAQGRAAGSNKTFSLIRGEYEVIPGFLPKVKSCPTKIWPSQGSPEIAVSMHCESVFDEELALMKTVLHWAINGRKEKKVTLGKSADLNQPAKCTVSKANLEQLMLDKAASSSTSFNAQLEGSKLSSEGRQSDCDIQYKVVY